MSSSRRLYGQVPYGVQRYTGFPTSVQHRRHLVPITSDLDMHAGKHTLLATTPSILSSHCVCVTAALRLQSGMGCQSLEEEILLICDASHVD